MQTAIDGFVAIYFGVFFVLGLFWFVEMVVHAFDELVKAVTGE